MNIQELARRAQLTIRENSPAILTALGVAGVASTAYLSSRAGYYSAAHTIHAQIEEGRNLTAKEKVELNWKKYIPVVLVAGGTIGFIIGAHNVSMRRNAALMSAVTLGETALREYRDKMVELAGANKDQKAIADIAKDDVEKNPPSEKEFVLLKEGEQMFRDKYTGRYFMSTVDKIRKAENKINNQIIKHDYALLNDFYTEIGLESVDAGDEMGFNNGHMLELEISAVPFQDKAILVVSFKRLPVPNPYGVWT